MTAISKFGVSGITCQSCVSKIESTLVGTGRFNSVKVLRDPDRIEVSSENGLNTTDLQKIFTDEKLNKYEILDSVDAIKNDNSDTSENQESLFTQLFPLTLVISYLLITVITIAIVNSDFSPMSLMSHYMGGFFIIFSFFKFLNIGGFVDAFQTYDPIAKSWRPYGYFYASFELIAGVSYLLSPTSLLLNLSVLVLLSISSIGVWKAVRNKSKIQCACLGTIFNLPMTKVTIVENASMITMAAFAIYSSFGL